MASQGLAPNSAVTAPAGPSTGLNKALLRPTPFSLTTNPFKNVGGNIARGLFGNQPVATPIKAIGVGGRTTRPPIKTPVQTTPGGPTPVISTSVFNSTPAAHFSSLGI